MRTGGGFRIKEILENLKKTLSEGGDAAEIIKKIAHTPEESQQMLEELSKEYQMQN